MSCNLADEDGETTGGCYRNHRGVWLDVDRLDVDRLGVDRLGVDRLGVDRGAGQGVMVRRRWPHAREATAGREVSAPAGHTWSVLADVQRCLKGLLRSPRSACRRRPCG